MPPPAYPTLRQHLARACANLGMAEMASHAGVAAYGRVHYAVRSKLYREMAAGRSSPRSVVLDQAIRVKMTPACVYCGAADRLTQDHVVPTVRGGADSADNTVTACRGCNASKGGRDLFAWWAVAREPGTVPPLFVVRVWLKQARSWAEATGAMEKPLATAPRELFDLEAVPLTYPEPDELSFTPWHDERANL